MGTQVLATIHYSGIMVVVGVGAVVLVAAAIELLRLAIKHRGNPSLMLASIPSIKELFTSPVKESAELVPDPVEPPDEESEPGKGVEPEAEAARDTSPGDEQVQKLTVRYKKDLTKEAKRIARQMQADRPSKAHVNSANQNLRTPRGVRSELSDILLSIGSIIYGGVISHWPTLSIDGSTTGGNWPLVTAGAVVGTLFVAVAITLKVIRR